ncbi:aspartyl protease family protein [Nonomuraea typhae]|uniref:Aspartyl protease family protein n=1 Tax=Nonomuraea typhae TaxID=2603600 RepID=A0ABW7YPM4_9ACTN
MNRRTFLHGATAAAGAMLLPATTAEDPDKLFKQGNFAGAERAYRRQLRKDERNARAHAQIGYIALLSNRFRVAETHLTKAIELSPRDIASTQRLAECFVRQDRLSSAVPLLRRTGRPRDTAYAEMFSAISGKPWQISGARSARLPFLTVDPVPFVEASINGGKRQPFILDTYATLDLSQEAADAAGLRAVATQPGGVVDGQEVVLSFGVLDSFKVGGIEIRNLPVQWNPVKRPTLPNGTDPAGAFGTTIFYHFLTTMDYAGKTLELRRTPGPERGKLGRLPLWLAGDHFPCTLGTLGDYGPTTVTVDTGGIASALDITVENAERVGFKVDYEHPNDRFGRSYPVTAHKLSLGRAVRRNVVGTAVEKPGPGMPAPGHSEQFGFDLMANFTHEFFKPFAITFDYTRMRLSID